MGSTTRKECKHCSVGRGYATLKEQLKVMAMLASDKPEFTNPTVIAAAKKLRDKILRGG